MDDNFPLFDGGQAVEYVERRRTQHDEIFAKFKVFHATNPHVWALFEQFTLAEIANGAVRWGAFHVLNKIRWDVPIPTHGEPVKVPNNYAPYYARMFHAKHPRYGLFFELRKLTTMDKPARRNGAEIFFSGPPENEESVMAELRAMLGIVEEPPSDSEAHSA